MTQGKSLWGNLDSLDPVRTPAVVLNEQARFLSEETNFALLGEVLRMDSPSGGFLLSLRVVVPNLNRYTFEIMKVQYSELVYPVTVFADGQEFLANTMDEFLVLLEETLKSERVTRALATLKSESGGIGPTARI